MILLGYDEEELRRRHKVLDEYLATMTKGDQDVFLDRNPVVARDGLHSMEFDRYMGYRPVIEEIGVVGSNRIMTRYARTGSGGGRNMHKETLRRCSLD